MSSTAQKIYDSILDLPEIERSELAARILEDLEPETWNDAAWEGEIQKRVDDIRSGQATMVSWEEVRQLLWKEAHGLPGSV